MILWEERGEDMRGKLSDLIGYMLVFVICCSTNFLWGTAEYTKQEEVLIVMNQGNENKGKLAIVIDDFGYGAEGTEDMMNLDIPLTLAIMPFSAYSEQEGIQAIEKGKEVIIHMPFESLTGKPEWVGERGIFRTMTDEEIIQTTKEAMAILPMAVGMNNHMGSAIMEDERSLSVVLDIVKEADMIFLDSVTSSDSKAPALTAEKGITFFKRDVFLDSTQDLEKVKANVKQAGEVALKQGYAVAIGHVGPEGGNVTVQGIQQMQAELEAMGVEFVFLSALQ